MSGIVGLWNLDGKPADAGILERMSAALAHRGPDGEGHRLAGPVGLACRHLWVTPEEAGETQPLVGRTGALLVMDGRLDNRDELLPALDLPKSASDAACVLAAYETWGEGFPERLNGDFALAVFDAARSRILLVRDSIGICPLYFLKSDRLFAFATEVKALLAHPDIPTRPDDEGLADYLLVSSRPMDHQELTCFAGISAVVPAHVVTVTPDALATRRYWDFDTGRSQRFGSFADYVDGFREQFARAVARRSRTVHGVAVSVSGGLDSSSILCQAETMRRAGRIPAARMIGISYVGAADTPADERRFIAEIEREYRMAITRIPIEPLLGVVHDSAQQVRAIEAPLLDYMWGVTRAMQREAARAGARILLSGHYGDQMLFSTAYLGDLFRTLDWGELRRHTRGYRQWCGPVEARLLERRFVSDLLRQSVPGWLVPPLKWLRRRVSAPEGRKRWLTPGFRRLALKSANRPATIGTGFHSAQARSLYLEARSKYHVQCLAWANNAAALDGLVLAFPFLDRDLISFLMMIPGEVHSHAGVPRGLLREALKGVLPEPIRLRTWKADFSLLANASVEQGFAGIASALTPSCVGVRLGYLSADALTDEVTRMGRGLDGPDCVASWELTDILGLEQWLQVFLGNAHAATADVQGGGMDT